MKIVIVGINHAGTFALQTLMAQNSRHQITTYVALALQQKITLFDVAFTDVYFLPHCNKAFNFALASIMKAIGLDYYKD